MIVVAAIAIIISTMILPVLRVTGTSMNPTLKNVFVEKLSWGDDLSANAATMICSAVQFFLYFPVDKILFHKKKEEKTEEPAAK